MDKKIERYYQLKQQLKEIEEQLAHLRGEILDRCAALGAAGLETGAYTAKLVLQQRREYDDQKLYDALPDPEVWRMLSRADPSKIASLIKLNVISEEKIKDTYLVKNVALLQVNKR